MIKNTSQKFWNNSLMIKKTRNGKGLFTQSELKPQEYVFQVTGRFMTSEECNAVSDEVASNSYRYSENLYISPTGEIGDYLNHSCNPNAYIRKSGKDLFVCAIGTISSKEEIVIDYSTILARDDIWAMECNCGEKNCRGLIKRFQTLPKKLKEKYKNENIAPQYILKI